MPAGRLSYPVLLGKNTPGLTIHWSIGPPPEKKTTHKETDQTKDVAVITRAQQKRILEEEQKDEEDTRRDGVIPTSLENIPDDATIPTEL